MQLVQFLEWEFLVDRAATIAGYENVTAGDASICTCTMCENFVASRDHIYPDLVKTMFHELGIDYRKECETYHMAKLENGLHYYGGCFQFIGQITKGDNMKTLTGRNHYCYKTTAVSDFFDITFIKEISVSFFDKKKYKLIQIEFRTSIPWVIDQEKEPT